MALVQLSDVIFYDAFTDYVVVNSVALSAFVQSGVIVEDPFLNEFLAGQGQVANLPFYNDLADTEASVGSDDDFGTDDLVPDNISTGEQIVVRNNRNHAWSASDLVSALIGNDPMAVIAGRVAAYWSRQLQLRLIASTQGVVADNEANDAGDMVHDISTQAAIGSANLFNAEGVIDAVQTMGDHGESSLAAIAMNSVPYARAKKNNLIDFVQDSANPLAASIPFYNGLRVIVDDGLLADTSATNDTYDTYLYGLGAFRMGQGRQRVPTEVERQALAGRGSGQEYLVSRMQDVLHPWGTAFIDQAGLTDPGGPTNAELAVATAWDRRVDRKLVPLAVLRSNG